MTDDTLPRVVPSKATRHAVITRLLQENVIRSQRALQNHLNVLGFNVTQATLSRDLEELSATKIRDRDGNPHYSLVPTEGATEGAKPLNGSLDYWVKQFLLKSTCVCNQVILRTHPAAASPLASIIDKENLDGVLGTIAGDNTLLIICRDEESAQALHELLLSISGLG